MASSSDGSVHWTFRTNGQEMYVALKGTLSMPNSEELFAALKPLAKSPEPMIYFSLRDLDRCDSAGLGVIVGLNSQLRSAKKTVMMLEPNSFVRKLFKLARMDLLLKIETGISADITMKEMEKLPAADSIAALGATQPLSS